MPDDGQIQLVVGADISGAAAQFQKFDDNINAINDDIAQTIVQLDKMYQALNNAAQPEQIEALEAGIVQLEANLGKLQDRAIAASGATETFAATTETAATAATSAAAAYTAETAGLTASTEAAIVADKATTSLLNSTQKQRIAFTDVARVATGQGFSIRSLASNFALLGPEITVVAGIIYVFYEALSKLADGEKKATDNEKDFQDVLKSTAKDLGDQVAKATTLYNALGSGTLDTGQRKKALQDLKNINEEYFGSLKDEKGIIDGLSASYNQYIANISKLAQSKAIEEALQKAFDKQLTLKLKIDPVFQATTNQDVQKQVAHLTEELNKAGGPVDLSGKDKQNVLDATQNDNLQKRIQLQDQLNNLTNGSQIRFTGGGISQDKDELKNVNAYIAGLEEIQAKLQNFNIEAAKVKSTKTDTQGLEGLLNEIKRVKEELAKPNNGPIFKLLDASKDDDGIKLLQIKIQKAIEEGNKLGTDDAKKYATELGNLYQQQISKIRNPNLQSKISGIVDPASFKGDNTDQVESQIEKEFLKGGGIHVKVPADIIIDDKLSDNTKKQISELLKRDQEAAVQNIPIIRWNPKIQAVIDQAYLREQVIKQINETATKIVQGVATSSLADVGIAIGNVLAGAKNPLQSALQGLGDALGDGLIAIGKQLIIGSTIIQGIKIALKSLFANPVVGIAVGVAAVAAGEFVKAEVNKTGQHAFADGGVVTGPTNALVGEKGPEVIFPLNKINDFIKKGTSGGSNVNVTGESRISGNDLMIVLSRAQKNQSFV